jgi:hypothetical protein
MPPTRCSLSLHLIVKAETVDRLVAGLPADVVIVSGERKA